MTMPSIPPAPISLPGTSNQQISFPSTTAAPSGSLSAEQLVLLQNNILQQQNQALQNLLTALIPSNPTPPTSTPSPEMFSLLKNNQLPLPKPVDSMPQDLLQNLLLQPRQQAVFSNSM